MSINILVTIKPAAAPICQEIDPLAYSNHFLF
jgi:hypothetical protein